MINNQRKMRKRNQKKIKIIKKRTDKRMMSNLKTFKHNNKKNLIKMKIKLRRLEK